MNNRFLPAFIFISKNFGLKSAWNLIVKPRLFPKLGIRTKTYNEALLSWIEKLTSDIIESYKVKDIDIHNCLEVNSKIFVCWWQGKNEMPEVIRQCYLSLVRNAGTHEIIFIDKNNFRQYADIPDDIIKKLESKAITFSHFSDILRHSLLGKYGGLWIDSAIYLTKPLNLTGLFYSLRLSKGPIEDCQSQGRWVSGIIGGGKSFKLFLFVSECLSRYWQKYNVIVDYLLQDAIMRIAYEKFIDIRECIDALPVNSPDLMKSRYLFDKEVDYNIFERVIADNSFLSLTWRINYKETTMDGKETYYGALINKFR